jgi:ketosteroid isomerase-like protein
VADNVKTIKECFDAFARGDAAFIVARVTDDVDWRPPGTATPYGGNYKGPQGAGQFFAKIGGAVEVTKWEPKHVVASGSAVIAWGHWEGKARPTGKSFASDWGMEFGFKGDKISSFRVVEDTAHVAAAFRP